MQAICSDVFLLLSKEAMVLGQTFLECTAYVQGWEVVCCVQFLHFLTERLGSFCNLLRATINKLFVRSLLGCGTSVPHALLHLLGLRIPRPCRPFRLHGRLRRSGPVWEKTRRHFKRGYISDLIGPFWDTQLG